MIDIEEESEEDSSGTVADNENCGCGLGRCPDVDDMTLMSLSAVDGLDVGCLRIEKDGKRFDGVCLVSVGTRSSVLLTQVQDAECAPMGATAPLISSSDCLILDIDGRESGFFDQHSRMSSHMLVDNPCEVATRPGRSGCLKRSRS